MSEALANSYSFEPTRPSNAKGSTSNSHGIRGSPNPLSNLNQYQGSSIPAIVYARFFFPDTKAIFDLDLKSYMDLAYKETTLTGYEIYLVEQWTAERKLSSIITSCTGNSQDTITGVEILLPKNFELWPGRFKQYYEELSSFAKAKYTKDNDLQLFITDLSNIPLSLNILHIECGDLRTIWNDYRVNFNLKMLHCAGRSSALLLPPSNASQEKFEQLYRVPLRLKKNSNNSNNIFENFIKTENLNLQKQQPSHNHEVELSPVTDVILLMQICLYYFNRYNNKIDGLFCNHTKRAVSNWWEDYGKLYFGMEKPKNESTLGPSTVAAILSLVLCAYYKLTLENCLNSKHPFNTIEYINGIYNFQKKVGIVRPNKKIYLDHLTLEKLFEATDKFSNTDILHLKKIMKSKMQDLAGKSNTIRLSNDILTTNLDTLLGNVHTGYLAYIWKNDDRSKFGYKMEEKINFVNFNFNKGNPKEELKRRDELLRNTKLKPRFVEPTNLKRNGKTWKPLNANQFVESRFTEDMIGIENMNLSQSMMSISSMLPNYDKPIPQYNVKTNRAYQGEFYRRNSFPFINDGTHEMVEDKLCKTSVKRCLYRCNSQSKISESLERWELPFDPSIIKIARDLKRIDISLKRQTKLNEGDNSGPDPNDHLSMTIENVACRVDVKEISKYNDISLKLQRNYEKYNEKSATIEGRARILENKRQILASEMKEVSSLSSKLSYDIRILDLRVRDVEDSIRHFESKLGNVKKSLLVEDKNVTDALDNLSNKAEFDRCIKRLAKSEKACYEGVCMRFLNKDVILDLREDIMSWVNYFFQGFTLDSREQIQTGH